MPAGRWTLRVSSISSPETLPAYSKRISKSPRLISWTKDTSSPETLPS